VRQRPGLRRQLKLNIASLRAGLRTLGLGVEDGPAANFSVEIGGAANMRRIHEALKAAGILVPYVAAYSGLGPEGVLRFAVCARHTPEQIGQLLSTLRKIV
jgi:7-keto-8-aminopelargonate synthetase-like enzyme